MSILRLRRYRASSCYLPQTSREELRERLRRYRASSCYLPLDATKGVFKTLRRYRASSSYLPADNDFPVAPMLRRYRASSSYLPLLHKKVLIFIPDDEAMDGSALPLNLNAPDTGETARFAPGTGDRCARGADREPTTVGKLDPPELRLPTGPLHDANSNGSHFRSKRIS